MNMNELLPMHSDLIPFSLTWNTVFCSWCDEKTGDIQCFGNQNCNSKYKIISLHKVTQIRLSCVQYLVNPLGL